MRALTGLNHLVCAVLCFVTEACVFLYNFGTSVSTSPKSVFAFNHKKISLCAPGRWSQILSDQLLLTSPFQRNSQNNSKYSEIYCLKHSQTTPIVIRATVKQEVEKLNFATYLTIQKFYDTALFFHILPRKSFCLILSKT